MVSARSLSLIVVLAAIAARCNGFTDEYAYSLHDILENVQHPSLGGEVLETLPDFSESVRSITLDGKRKEAVALPVPSTAPPTNSMGIG